MGLFNMLSGRNQVKPSKKAQEQIDRDFKKREAKIRQETQKTLAKMKAELRLVRIIGHFTPKAADVFTPYVEFIEALLNVSPEVRDATISSPKYFNWLAACSKRIHLHTQSLEYIFPDDPIWKTAKYDKYEIVDFGDVE